MRIYSRASFFLWQVRADRLELGSSVGPDGEPQPVWDTVSFARDVPASHLWRYTLDVAGGKQAAAARQLSPRHLDFPVVNAPRVSGLPHRYVWAACGADPAPGASSPPQGIVKVDTSGAEADQVWQPEPWQFCGEPCFARRAVAAGPEAGAAAAEDAGYVLTLVTDGRLGTAELVVLDAANVAAGPVARVPIAGTNLPHGLHGCWAEDARFSDDKLAKANTLLKLYARKSMEWNQVDAAFSGLGIGQFFGQKGLDGR
jgi:carotenoid cleavage dioxygenase-like enzyme